MSRANHLSTPSQNIFITTITDPNGQKRSVISAKALGDLFNESDQFNRSIRVNRCGNSGALFLLMTLCSQASIYQKSKKELLPQNVWMHIFGYLFISNANAPTAYYRNPLDDVSLYYKSALHAIGNYALSVRRLPSIFQTAHAPLEPFIVVDAAMRGEEDMVLNILRANPWYLLEKEIVINSVGMQYEVTPLQAAIMADDIQLAVKMKEHFEHLPDGEKIMFEQLGEIYKKSMCVYFDKQKNIIQRLTESRNNAVVIDEAVLAKAQALSKKYLNVLQNKDIALDELVKIHSEAQEENAFDFTHYVDAILNPNLPQTQLDAAMKLIYATQKNTAIAIANTGVSPIQTATDRATPFDQLTLVQQLNRFREKFVAHMQSEIIFNPHHILAGLKSYEKTWDTLPAAADPDVKKRSLIFCQLAGWAQRNAAEPVRQDIRQGICHLIAKKELRSRPQRFNDLNNSNSKVDVSLVGGLHIIDDWGYKFGVNDGKHVQNTWGERPEGRATVVFSKLITSKNVELGKLILQLTSSHQSFCEMK